MEVTQDLDTVILNTCYLVQGFILFLLVVFAIWALYRLINIFF